MRKCWIIVGIEDEGIGGEVIAHPLRVFTNRAEAEADLVSLETIAKEFQRSRNDHKIKIGQAEYDYRQAGYPNAKADFTYWELREAELKE